MPRVSAVVGRHGLVRDEIYTVLQGSVRTFVSTYIQPPTYPNPSWVAPLPPFLDLPWIQDELPHMFLIPQSSPFRQPLFDRLGYSLNAFPVERGANGGWSLAPSLITEWVTLERHLRTILSAMMDIVSSYLPRLFRLWAFPDQFGYTRAYRRRTVVQTVALQSRQAFLPLMSAITLMALLLEQHANVVTNLNWRDRILAKTQIHPAWLESLERSIVFDFNYPRVGGIIDMTKFTRPELLRVFKDLDLTIYLRWGQWDNVPVYAHRYIQNAQAIPSSRDAQTLHSERGRENYRTIRESPPSPPRTYSTPASPTPNPFPETSPTNPLPVPSAPEPVFPPVDPTSRQRQGEHWKDFFARRARSNAQTVERETPREKQSRLEKEKNALRHECPGRKGARVYVWEEDQGFRIRRPAGRRNYEHYWDIYRDSQRRYDPFRDEWDLCSEFDPDPEDCAPMLDDSDESDAAGDVLPDNLLPEISYPSVDRTGEHSSATDLQRQYHDTVTQTDERSDRTRLVFDPVDAIAHFKFGFSPDQPVEPPVVEPTWAVVCELLGCGPRFSSTPAQVSTEIQNSLCKFFGYFQFSEHISRIPPQLYDVHQPHANIYTLPRRITFNKLEASENDSPYFIISSRNDSNPRVFILLKSPAVLVEILRRGWSGDFVSLARQLLDRGIPFRTGIPGPYPSMRFPPTAPDYPGLGRRAVNYVPNQTDYQAYESIRECLLQSVRSRAALLAGGIIARLAREVVPYDDVFQGPTNTAYQNGFYISTGYNRPGFYDDQLTEHEENVICGLYKRETGHSGPNQTSDASWWPKSSIWEASSLWTGYWSADCESWFQDRLAKCRNGTADLRTAAKWRQSLKFNRAVHQAAKTSEARALDWLENR